MKRDWNLVRTILNKVRDEDFTDIADHEARVVSEHIRLLVEAGLLEGRPTETGYSLSSRMRLTWSGHEFVESAQDEQRYRTAVEKVSATGSVSFEIIKTVIAELARRSIFGS